MINYGYVKWLPTETSNGQSRRHQVVNSTVRRQMVDSIEVKMERGAKRGGEVGGWRSVDALVIPGFQALRFLTPCASLFIFVTHRNRN